MRRIAPLIIRIVTTVLILAAAAMPTAAMAAGPQPTATSDGSPVTVIHPPAGTAGAFGISDGPGGVWFSHGGTLNRTTPHGIDEFPVPGPTPNTGTLAWKPGGPLWFADRATAGSAPLTAKAKFTPTRSPIRPALSPSRRASPSAQDPMSGSPISPAARSTGSTSAPGPSTCTRCPPRPADHSVWSVDPTGHCGSPSELRPRSAGWHPTAPLPNGPSHRAHFRTGSPSDRTGRSGSPN